MALAACCRACRPARRYGDCSLTHTTTSGLSDEFAAELAEFMPGRLRDLDASGQRLAITTLGLYATFPDPTDPASEIKITRLVGIGALVSADSLSDAYPSSTEA